MNHDYLGIQEAGRLLNNIINQLSGMPVFLFGVIPMLIALGGLYIIAAFPTIPSSLALLPYAFLLFGFLVIIAHITAAIILPNVGPDMQNLFKDGREQNLSKEQVRERISRIADFDWTVVEPRVKHWAEHQGAANPYDLGPKNWERCLYDLGLSGGRKHTLEYNRGRLKYK